ncbi:uncharacterized protein K441DRAFT_213834 [Cenococcum geophilum 1.58]|uniref:uncharacterized protein n=1 Tax=Cenococcum geophilum 1.58 TaxID=794803 RepID=UPI00358F3070|nr:hypothetical protein K441DRAFT_213834 [Cenococcum geophilum 1.58]
MKGLKSRIYICTIPWRCEPLPLVFIPYYSPSDRPDSATRRLTNVHRNSQPSLPKTSLYGKDFRLPLLTSRDHHKANTSIAYPSGPSIHPKPFKFSQCLGKRKKNLPPSGRRNATVELKVASPNIQSMPAKNCLRVSTTFHLHAPETLDPLACLLLES